jgi:hypothetical protein
MSIKSDFRRNDISIGKFLSDNVSVIVLIILFIIVSGIFALSFNIRKLSKIERYNKEIYRITGLKQMQKNLEYLYEKKDVPRISKTLAGIILASEYGRIDARNKTIDVANKDNNKNINTHRDKIIDIYSDIFFKEKDTYFKYYAGLNLLILKINDKKQDIREIDDLIKKMENKKNPLLDLVLEQKALFFIKQNKKDEAKNILDGLLKKEINAEFSNRINHIYKLLY